MTQWILAQVNVRRSFHGNYSCQGRNKAGWGATSAQRELRVLYPPKGANLTQHPSVVIKGSPFRVRSRYKGNTKNTRGYKWDTRGYRGIQRELLMTGAEQGGLGRHFGPEGVEGAVPA